MYAPRLTYISSPTLSIPYLSLEGLMENRKRLFDQLLSGEKDDGPLQKKHRFGTWNRLPDVLAHQVETSGLVFAFELIETARLQLAWVRSDTAAVKDRFLGSDDGPCLGVLNEFYSDVFEIQDRGIIVTHGMRWKSALLEAQFTRFELDHLAACWRTLTQRVGLCLMSPEIGSWWGVPAADDSEYRKSMDDLCRGASLQHEPEATPRDGALRCFAILKQLRQLARPPCTHGEAPYDFSCHHCGMRDNGEAVTATCSLCGHRS